MPVVAPGEPRVFIIGTGVGGGIIANGQLVRGVHFTAGEYSFVNTNASSSSKWYYSRDYIRSWS